MARIFDSQADIIILGEFNACLNVAKVAYVDRVLSIITQLARLVLICKGITRLILEIRRQKLCRNMNAFFDFPVNIRDTVRTKKQQRIKTCNLLIVRKCPSFRELLASGLIGTRGVADGGERNCGDQTPTYCAVQLIPFCSARPGTVARKISASRGCCCDGLSSWKHRGLRAKRKQANQRREGPTWGSHPRGGTRLHLSRDRSLARRVPRVSVVALRNERRCDDRPDRSVDNTIHQRGNTTKHFSHFDLPLHAVDFIS